MEPQKVFTGATLRRAWKRYLPPASEKAATVATVATRDRGNVAAVADVATFQKSDDRQTCD